MIFVWNLILTNKKLGFGTFLTFLGKNSIIFNSISFCYKSDKYLLWKMWCIPRLFSKYVIKNCFFNYTNYTNLYFSLQKTWKSFQTIWIILFMKNCFQTHVNILDNLEFFIFSGNVSRQSEKVTIKIYSFMKNSYQTHVYL